MMSLPEEMCGMPEGILRHLKRVLDVGLISFFSVPRLDVQPQLSSQNY